MPNFSWSTSSIRLRAVEPADAQLFFEWNQDSQRNRALDFLWPPTSLASVQAWAQAESLKKLENDTYHWVIEDIDHQPVGSISTHSCSPHDGTFSYGIDIAAPFRGHGYASQAIGLVLRYYFEELRYQKVTVPIHADNPPSIKLHEKLGFHLEGRLRRMFFTGGQYVDVLWYGLTTEEWQAGA